MGKPKKLRRLTKAANMGKPYAMYRLGICFQTGTMTEQQGKIGPMDFCCGRSGICSGDGMDAGLLL